MDLDEEIGIEMEFEVQLTSLALFPLLSIFNEWGTEVLWATDVDTEWHGRPRPAGRYRVTAWIPGNFLTAGAMSVTAALCSLAPRVEHFREVDAVGFQAVDTLGGPAARGDYTGHIGAATRPKLEWTVDCECRSPKVV
jgi:lipopolysaccharide transport system ATP-binding protein